MLRSVYNTSSGNKHPQPWEYDSGLFPHDHSFTKENLRHQLENAYKDCRNYVAIALPSLFLGGAFHLVHFLVLKDSPLVIKYQGCFPESHSDGYCPLLSKTEAIRWSQELPVKTPNSKKSESITIRLINGDANHAAAEVFVHQIEGDEPKTIDEWNDRVIQATTDALEGEEISGHVGQSVGLTAACAKCFGPWRGRDCLSCGADIKTNDTVYSHPCLNLPPKIRCTLN